MGHNVKILRQNKTMDSKEFKLCTGCNSLKSVAEYGKIKKGTNTKCKQCIKYYNIHKAFGLSKSQYDAILKYQGSMCKICDMHISKCGSKGLAIDHDHSTGMIRGLLCVKCNSAIGLLKEDMRIMKRAIDYLSRKSVAKIYNPNKED